MRLNVGSQMGALNVPVTPELELGVFAKWPTVKEPLIDDAVTSLMVMVIELASASKMEPLQPLL